MSSDHFKAKRIVLDTVRHPAWAERGAPRALIITNLEAQGLRGAHHYTNAVRDLKLVSSGYGYVMPSLDTPSEVTLKRRGPKSSRGLQLATIAQWLATVQPCTITDALARGQAKGYQRAHILDAVVLLNLHMSLPTTETDW